MLWNRGVQYAKSYNTLKLKILYHIFNNYNAAYKYVPTVCEKITSTVKDPFYNNGSIEMFMDSIYEYLNKQDEETLKSISEK